MFIHSHATTRREPDSAQAGSRPNRLSWLPGGSLLASLAFALGLCGVVGVLLLKARNDAWDLARREVSNMRRLVERDLARNLELFDLSLRAAAENLSVPGVPELPHDTRQLVLFDRAISASHIGTVM